MDKKEQLRKSLQTPFKYGKAVLAPSGIKRDYCECAVDCPFVFWHNGEYYMLHVGFDGKGYQTAVARSCDLLNWKYEAMIFERNEEKHWDSGSIAGMWILRNNNLREKPKLKKVDGKYWMVYHSYPRSGYEAGPAEIGLAYTTDETLHNWTRLESPILSWKNGENWERAGLYKGCILEENGKYYLFYNAKDSENWIWHEQIGLAVSDDMIHWERWGKNPVIRNQKKTWEEYFCADPCVVKDGEDWLMFYYGYDGKHAQQGVAYSKDLFHWTKLQSPILRNGVQGEVDALHAHKPSVIWKDGVLYHYYCAVREGRQEDIACNDDPTITGSEKRKEYRCISVAASQPFR